MTSLNVTTSESGKIHKRIMPDTPIAVTVPHQGNISLLYKGQVFTPGQESSSDAIYRSIYEDGKWKGGLDAPPVCPIRRGDTSRMAVISWSKEEVGLDPTKGFSIANKTSQDVHLEDVKNAKFECISAGEKSASYGAVGVYNLRNMGNNIKGRVYFTVTVVPGSVNSLKIDAGPLKGGDFVVASYFK